jgi:hypothetical protein
VGGVTPLLFRALHEKLVDGRGGVTIKNVEGGLHQRRRIFLQYFVFAKKNLEAMKNENVKQADFSFLKLLNLIFAT